jgi:hypothetical protein
MNIKDLIKQLKKCKNQNALIEIRVPCKPGYDDSLNDFISKDFEVHNGWNEDSNYIEFYTNDTLKGVKASEY